MLAKDINRQDLLKVLLLAEITLNLRIATWNMAHWTHLPGIFAHQ
jgi:hypothetical protein